jgi:hypothetical protein
MGAERFFVNDGRGSGKRPKPNSKRVQQLSPDHIVNGGVRSFISKKRVNRRQKRSPSERNR